MRPAPSYCVYLCCLKTEEPFRRRPQAVQFQVSRSCVAAASVELGRPFSHRFPQACKLESPALNSLTGLWLL